MFGCARQNVEIAKASSQAITRKVGFSVSSLQAQPGILVLNRNPEVIRESLRSRVFSKSLSHARKSRRVTENPVQELEIVPNATFEICPIPARKSN